MLVCNCAFCRIKPYKRLYIDLLENFEQLKCFLLRKMNFVSRFFMTRGRSVLYIFNFAITITKQKSFEYFSIACIKEIYYEDYCLVAEVDKI